MFESLLGKQTPNYENFEGVIPRELNLYDVVDLKLKAIEIDKITPDALNNYFRRSISSIFTINGELNGHAISQLDAKYEFGSEELGIKDIFVEASNIIIGHIISHVENQFDALSHLSAPLVINDNGKGANEHLKKMRILAILNKSLNDRQFYQLDYELLIEGERIPFHIFLMLNLKEVFHDH